MKFIKILIVLINFSRVYGEVCPKMCTCDIFEGFRRADCSDANLVSPYTNVAKSVEILNLSGNDITTIDNHCLEDYRELKKLSLARNSIHILELFAFDQLEKLNYLDLSDNRIEEFDHRLLENCEKLTFLDLSKNKFMNLDDRPLIRSTSLEFLSLQNSHLSHIYDSHFSELPNLVDLDISNNLLITLMSSSFNSFQQLKFINLEYNRFSCDYRIEQTLQLFKERKVHVKIDKCVKNSKKPMFEKMIMAVEMTTEEAPREDIDIDLVWGDDVTARKSNENSQNPSTPTKILRLEHFRKYYKNIKENSDDDDDDGSGGEFDCDDEDFFPSTCECRQNFIQFYDFNERVKKIQQNDMEIRIAVIFYLGIFIGCFFGYVVYFLVGIIRKKLIKANKKQKERQTARDQMIALENVRLVVENTSNQSPMPAIRNLNLNSDIEIPSTRSPIPTPRNNNRNNPLTVHSTTSPIAEQQQQRRTTENSPRPINLIQRTSSQRIREEDSPTARLIHRLFRDRDRASILPGPSPLITTPQTQRRNDTPVGVVPAASDDESDSEFLSVENLTMNNSRASTPPPAYKTIFIDENE